MNTFTDPTLVSKALTNNNEQADDDILILEN
jgi:hypothetical protein